MNRLDKLPDGWPPTLKQLEDNDDTFMASYMLDTINALLASGKARIETNKGYSGDTATGPSYSRLIIELE